MASVKPLIIDSPVCYIGDPTQADGAGMMKAGEIRGQVDANPNGNVYHGMLDRTGTIPLAGTGYTDGGAPQVTVPLIGYGLETLVKLVTNAAIYEKDDGSGSMTPTDILGLGSAPGPRSMESYFTLALIPRGDAAAENNGIDSKSALWYPRAFVANEKHIKMNMPDSDDYLTDHADDVEFHAAYAAEDQGGTPIPEPLRRGFYGPVSDTDLGWSLPEYDASV